MANSGYLYVSSMVASRFDADALITNSFMPRAGWFGIPSDAGTLTHVDMLLYATNTLPTVGFEVEIWASSGANGFTIPSVSNSWFLLGVASFSPNSAPIGNVRSSALWVRAALNTPVWMETRGRNLTLMQGAIFSYAYKITRTGSWATATQDIKIPTKVTENLMWGNTAIRSLNRDVADRYADMPIGLYGLVSVSSHYRDAAIPGVWQCGSYDAAASQGMISSMFVRRGFQFTAIGSAITRFALDMAWDGNTQMRLTGILYTDSGDTPNVIVRTSTDKVIVNSNATFASNIFVGDVNSMTAIAAFEMGNSGVAVTSGDKYWAVVEVDSFDPSASGLAPLTQRIAGTRRASYNAQSSQWAVTTGQILQGLVWYVDSKTSWDFQLDIATLAPIVSASGIKRSFPGLTGRQFPSTILREYHRP